MTATTAIVLASPERKRILRELLSLAEPWSLDTRRLYRPRRNLRKIPPNPIREGEA
jgi:hypothetical protein